MEIKIKAVTEIRTTYSEKEDMTFILREVASANGDPISTEVVGFYYGEPNDEDTEYYTGKLKAVFVY